MKRENKELFTWGIIIVLLFTGLVIGWTHTPLYDHYKEVQRENAESYLNNNWWKISQEERQYYIDKYHFLPGEIHENPLWTITEGEQKPEEEQKSISDNLINSNPILKFLLGY
ncbi:MAG: hypothetical protein IMZ53_15340 [Thermoplasmata archaeon]|nr:hypothetical protein [Thermoplasmata archaeon]